MGLSKRYQRSSQAMVALRRCNRKRTQQGGCPIDFQADDANQPVAVMAAEEQHRTGRRDVCNRQLASGKKLFDPIELFNGLQYRQVHFLLTRASGDGSIGIQFQAVPQIEILGAGAFCFGVLAGSRTFQGLFLNRGRRR